MASWDLLGPEGRGEDEPNEDAVPFVMRLDNEGLRIVSKMRRINAMVAHAYTNTRTNPTIRSRPRSHLLPHAHAAVATGPDAQDVHGVDKVRGEGKEGARQ